MRVSADLVILLISDVSREVFPRGTINTLSICFMYSWNDLYCLFKEAHLHEFIILEETVADHTNQEKSRRDEEIGIDGQAPRHQVPACDTQRLPDTVVCKGKVEGTSTD